MDGADAYRSNAVLRGLRNDIKRAIEPRNGSAGPYTRENANTAFTNDGSPIDASR
jgi:hypothetical protein